MTIPCPANSLFIRAESDGFLMVYSRITGMHMLNRTSAEIFSLINARHDVREIISCMNEKYSKVASKTIEQDVFNTLYAMRTLKIIEWDGDEKMLESDIGTYIGVAGESDYSKISKYLSYSTKNCDSISISSVPTNNLNYYLDIELRTRQFKLSEVFFIYKVDGVIEALISLYGLDTPSTPAVLGLIVCNKGCEEKLFFLYDSVVCTLLKHGRQKIKYQSFGEEQNDLLLDFLSRNGFSFEARLHREINNSQDIDIYSTFLQNSDSIN